MATEVITFDERTSALDPELVHEVLQVMMALADEGPTMVVVTHEMKFAREAADWIVFIDHGKLLEQGHPDDLFARPQHERTRRFVSPIEAPG
jgi:ABC-type polar amino acid transport system ATPase subunit